MEIKGATRLIETQRPWLLVEMIFVPLYDGQSDPREIWDWCGSHDYILGGFFDDHYSFDGWLSYADAMFVPREIANHFQLPFNLRRNPTQEAEIAILKQVCDERLKLIEYLHHEAEKRLVIIKDMEQRLHLQAN